jgi:hypothetical protein
MRNAGKAPDQAYQRSITCSFFGSAGLLLLADMAHATIMAATISMYAPRANVPRIAIAPPPLAFFQDSQARWLGASIVNFWLNKSLMFINLPARWTGKLA